MTRISSRELSEWMALATLDARVQTLTRTQEIDAEVAHRMVFDTDADLE